MIGKFIKTVVAVVTSIVFAVGGVSFLERTQADEKAPLTLELTEEHTRARLMLISWRMRDRKSPIGITRK